MSKLYVMGKGFFFRRVRFSREKRTVLRATDLVAKWVIASANASEGSVESRALKDQSGEKRDCTAASSRKKKRVVMHAHMKSVLE